MTTIWDLLVAHPDVVKQPDGTGEAKAWCPWHPDKAGRNPNLGINVAKKVVKCFVCGHGGAGMKGARKLADAWGVTLPPEEGRSHKAPPPALTSDDAMRKLKDAYRLTDETVAHFGIAAEPTYTGGAHTTRGYWSYMTHAGKRYKAFDRKVPSDKYLWARGAARQKIASMLYGAKDIPPGTELVYMVNGEPAVWVCRQAGVPAVASFGEGQLPERAVEELKERGVKAVCLVPDRDPTGENTLRKRAEIVRRVGLVATARELPQELGEKADVGDLYLWHQGDDQAFRTALQSLRVIPLPETDPLAETRYFRRANRFWMNRTTKEGDTFEVELTNFVATATEETVHDDGVTQTRYVAFEGKLDSGEPLPRIEVPAKDAAALTWLHMWSFRARVNAGPAMKESVREIIQRIAHTERVPQRMIYNHTGWRQINGAWLYLTPQGPIGGDEPATVQLPSTYNRYTLPVHPSSGPTESIRASLRFLDVASRRVTLPLLAYTYLAPLDSIVRPSFILFLRAHTGSLKSTLSALALSHFGSFTFDTPPMTWEATENAIYRYLFDVKDMMAWVDDFRPMFTETDMSRQHTKASRVFAAYGNRQTRARLDVNMQLRGEMPPRCVLLATGEIYPQGESVNARMLPSDFTREDVFIDRLTASQGEADLYPHAMAAYINWVAQRYDRLARELPERRAQYRQHAQGLQHARLPDAVATLFVGLEAFAEFAHEAGAIDDAEKERLRAEAWTTFLELARIHGQRLADENTVDHFLHVLDTLVAQGKVVFMVRGTHLQPPYGKELVGWYDDAYIYLEPTAAYNAVSRWVRSEGRSFPISEAGLRQALVERGIAIKPLTAGHNTIQQRMNGRMYRVMKLIRDPQVLPFSGALGAYTLDEDPGAGSDPAQEQVKGSLF